MPPRCRHVGEHEVVRHGQLGDQRELLVDGRDAGVAGGLGRARLERLAAHEYLAPVRPHHSCDDLDERRLAGAVLAEQRVHLGVPDLEIGSLERMDAAVLLADARRAQRAAAPSLARSLAWSPAGVSLIVGARLLPRVFPYVTRQRTARPRHAADAVRPRRYYPGGGVSTDRVDARMKAVVGSARSRRVGSLRADSGSAMTQGSDTVAGSIEGVSHFGIQVADLDRSIAFYRDLLGLELIARWVRDQPYIQELVGYPGVVLHVAVFRFPNSESFLEVLEYRNVEKTPVDPSNANPGTAHLCVYVPDLTALHARLAANGVRFVSGIKSPTIGPNSGAKVIYMIDPDGIRVELLETRLTLAGEPRGDPAEQRSS